MQANDLKELIYKFENLEKGSSSDGAILIGKAPFIGTKAWLNIMYPVLSDKEIVWLESELKTTIPEDYKQFLSDFSNGLIILSSTFSLYGLRRQINRDIKANVRQPYSILTPNIFERPKNAKDNYFFIGGYNWDGSHLYIDKETNRVHCCERWDATSKMQWTSFEEMITSEIKRLYLLFDHEGKEIDRDQKTIPY
jgi:hypothetical protein